MTAPIKHMLEPDQVADYWCDGYIVISGLLDEARLCEIDLETSRLNKNRELFAKQASSELRHDNSGNPVHDRLEPVIPHSAVFDNLSTDPLITIPIEQLLGDKASVFKEKLIYKPPGVEGYGPHQDYRYWDYLKIPADDILTLMINIDHSDARSGALEIFPGTHKSCLPAPAHNPLDVDPNHLQSLSGKLICCDPGDAILFHSMLAHRSARNASRGSRRAWFTSWIAGRWSNRYQQTYADLLTAGGN